LKVINVFAGKSYNAKASGIIGHILVEFLLGNVFAYSKVPVKGLFKILSGFGPQV
jgi:hypothetical protein